MVSSNRLISMETEISTAHCAHVAWGGLFLLLVLYLQFYTHE